MNEISPQEFIDGGYSNRVGADCLVWYHDHVVGYVERRKASFGWGYNLCYDDGGDYPVIATVDAYQLLRVEDISDKAALRRRCCALIDRVPDDELAEAYIELKAQTEWHEEIVALKARGGQDE